MRNKTNESLRTANNPRQIAPGVFFVPKIQKVANLFFQ